MANRYWRGGSGNINDTAHWAETDGGAGGFSVPTRSDNAFFTSLSHTTDYTVTINAAFECLDFNMDGPASGKVTWAGTSTMGVYGNLNLTGGSSKITRTYSGTLSMKATSGTKNITTNGATLRNFTMNGSGGTFQLQDDLWIDANAATFTLSRSAGTFNANGKVVYIRNCYAGTISGFTGTSTNRFYDLDILGLASQQTRISMGDRQGMNIANKLTAKGQAPGSTYDNSRLLIHTSKIGTISGPYTLNAAIVEAEYLDIGGFKVGGGADWDLSDIPGGCGDVGGNVGITFTTGVTRTWTNADGGSWNKLSNWNTGVPLPQDNCNMGIAYNAGAVITTEKTVMGKNIDFSGATGNPTLTMGNCNYGSNNIICGNLTLIEGMTFNHSKRRLIFLGTDPIYITSAGKRFYHIGGNQNTIHLQDALYAEGSTYMGCGFDSHGYQINALSWRSDNGQLSSAMSNNTWNFRDSKIYVIGVNNSDAYYNLHVNTVASEDAYLEISGPHEGAYYRCLFRSYGTSFKGKIFINTLNPTIFSWATTSGYKYDSFINEVKVKAGGTLGLCEGKTATINNIISLGTATNPVKLRSSTDGTTASMTCGNLINTQHLDIKDITCLTPNKMYVGKDSVNSGNISGFTFGSAAFVKTNSLQKGLINNWYLDSINESKDVTQSGNNGIKTDITYTTDRSGKINNAYSFNGSTSNIELTNTGLMASVAKSVSCWIKIDSDCSAFGRIFNHNITGSQWVFTLAGLSGGLYRIGGTPDNNSHYGGTTNYILDIDIWYHVVMTFDESTYKLYVDGVEYTPSTVTGSFGFSDTGKVYIGRGSIYPFKGSISDVKIYNRALSLNEILFLYQSNKPNICLNSLNKGLETFLKLDKNLKDSSAYENDATQYLTSNFLPNGKGLLFNDSYITTSKFFIGSKKKFSLSFWAKPFIKRALFSCEASNSFRIDIWGDAFNSNIVSQNGTVYYYYGMPIPLNVMSLITITVDNEVVKYYIDNVLKRTTTMDSVIADSISSYKIALGRSVAGTGHFNGVMKNARLFNRAITQEEVNLIYNTEKNSYENGLMGLYKLDNITGANDLSEFGLNGETVGTTLTTDKDGNADKAYAFNGTSDYIRVLYNAAQAPREGLTVGAWMYRPVWTESTTRSIISKTEGGGYLIQCVSGYLRGFIYANGGYRNPQVALSTLSAGWHSIYLTYDKRYARLWVDGVNVNTVDLGATYPIAYSSANALAIGCEATGGATPSGQYFDGSIYDVRIYNRALTETELLAIYNQ